VGQPSSELGFLLLAQQDYHSYLPKFLALTDLSYHVTLTGSMENSADGKRYTFMG